MKCDELKATTAQEIVRNEKDCDYMDELFGGVKMPPTQVYLKSEADKVIADLEQKLAAAQQMLRLNEPKALYSNLETMGRLKHEIDVVARRERHQKYKRCLAMAGLCDAKADWYYSIGENFRDCVQFNIKWRDKWYKLAEKFKETKETLELVGNANALYKEAK